MRDQRGFTLVEMIVAMAIFISVIVIASSGFNTVLTSTNQQAKTAQSNFHGVVGLELMRYDVEHAGYGIAWAFQNYSGTIQFKNLGGSASQELVAAANVPAAGVDATTLNAVRSTDIKPFSATTAVKEVNGTAVTHAAGGPDYLAMRSTVSALDDAARKWTYINYSTNQVDNLSYLKRWGTGGDITTADRFIAVRSSFTSSGDETKTLLMDASNNFEVTLGSGGVMPAGTNFKPADRSQVVVAYGMRSASSSALRMPYHRTDYYVSRPASGMPPNCNPGTGILYKTMVSHATGGFDTSYPLLECVGDMQVEFEYDANDDGNLSYLTPAGLEALTATDLRGRLKNVRIYLLSHDGGMDTGYSYPQGSIQVGDPRRPASSGRTLSSSDLASLFSADWRKYRWKIYTMVIRPKNLAQ